MYKIPNRIRRFLRSFANKAIILAYHRVINVSTDPQLLCVGMENFEQHLDIICKFYKPMSLLSLAECIENKRIPNKSVVLTFDDGYLDNLHYAKPLLEQYKVPATVFVTSGMIGRDREFWWDELESLILLSDNLPDSCFLEINGSYYEWNLKGDRGSLAQYNFWDVTKKYSPGPRFEMYKDLHRLMKPLSHLEQEEILCELKSKLDRGLKTRPAYRVCNHNELKSLACGIIEVGSHTISHPVLSNCSSVNLNNEIFGCKKTLEDIIGIPIKSFSYPFGGMGDIGTKSPKIVQAAGYRVAVANYSDFVTAKNDSFLLPRFLVRNWNGIEFARFMKVWFNA